MSQLKPKLKLMLDDARRHDVAQRRTLPGGLTLELAQHKNGDVQLTLIRFDVAPGPVEWSTVLKHWPERLPSPPPTATPHKEGRRYVLVARWPRPAEEELVTELVNA